MIARLKHLTKFILETMMIILVSVGFITILVIYLEATENPLSEITGNLIKEFQTAEAIEIAEDIGGLSIFIVMGRLLLKIDEKIDVGAAIAILMGVLWLTL